MRYIYLISFFIILIFSSLSSREYNNNNNKDKNKNDSTATEEKTISEDTVPQKILEVTEEDLEYFPAYDIYDEWDTIHVHSTGRFDWKNYHDSTLIFFENRENCGYFHPFQGTVNSDFGFRRRGFHYGIDIELKTGDTVYCAFEGKVRIARRSRTYGNLVVVRHNNGLETYYAHLSKINVETGQTLKEGEPIGLGGSTGRSTGSHLHFEVRYKGTPINPNDIISFSGNNLSCDSYKISRSNFEYIEKASRYNGSGDGYYTIRKGDTLSKIARRHGTTVKRLCQLNRMKSTTTLRVGRRIRV